MPQVQSQIPSKMANRRLVDPHQQQSGSAVPPMQQKGLLSDAPRLGGSSMILYYLVIFLGTVMTAVIWPTNINITPLSLIPLLLILLMAFQAWFFRSEQTDSGFSTAYGWEIPAEEQNRRAKAMSITLRWAIPLQLPLIVFFSSAVKLISIVIYFLSITATPLITALRAKAAKRRKKKASQNAENILKEKATQKED